MTLPTGLGAAETMLLFVVFCLDFSVLWKLLLILEVG